MNQFTRIILDAIKSDPDVRNALAEKYQTMYADFSEIDYMEDDRKSLTQADIDIFADIYEIIELPPEANIITDLLSSAISCVDNKGLVNWLRNTDVSMITTNHSGKKDAMTEYNGWTNHPTWLIGLWINNDEYLADSSARWNADEWNKNVNELVNELVNQYQLSKYARTLIDLYLSFVAWSELAEE